MHGGRLNRGRTDRGPIGSGAAALAVALVTFVIGGGIASTAAGQQVNVPGPPTTAPKQGAEAVPLSDGLLRETVRRLARGNRAPAGVDTVADGVLVEVSVERGAAAAIRSRIERLDGDVNGAVGKTLLQALVPADRLIALERDPRVLFVRPPLAADIPQAASGEAPAFAAGTAPLVGEEVAKTNAPAWHSAGITGEGVSVGIIDGFGGAFWDAAQRLGEVPAPAGVFCQQAGQTCDVFGGGTSHGVAVAETIHDMAPGATLYLASARTAADIQAAVNFFAANGVRIISRSQSAEYDGPGNGTGQLANVQNSAVSQGIAWFNSAGNSAARDPSRQGGYWRGPWRDADLDGWLEFGPGDELNRFPCSFVLGLRWSDWGSNRTDYDAYTLDETGTTFLTESEGNQPGGAPPIESIDCNVNGVVNLAVFLYAPGGGTGGDVLEFMVNSSTVEHASNPYSATQPFSDTANPGAASVGAVDPWDGTTIGSYSSEGPSNDGRIKPDLSAPACFSSVSSFLDEYTCNGIYGFDGTSAATPVVSGAAALVLDSGRAKTPAELKTFLIEQATTERGAPGPDNLFGAGELLLPNPKKKDRKRPKVRAFRSHGESGQTIRLRYRAGDNSGRTREVIKVKPKNRNWALDTIRTKFGRATGGRVYVKWRAPRRVPKGPLEFCVKAKDRSGNKSRVDCAALNVS